ncbi:MAG: hypothetical protein HY303_20015 [Candidatus Wallbacteria bacterium]|nr:hypothetical protein [Candidatus Wallbacteria bacterium]
MKRMVELSAVSSARSLLAGATLRTEARPTVLRNWPVAGPVSTSVSVSRSPVAPSVTVMTTLSMEVGLVLRSLSVMVTKTGSSPMP